MHKRIANKLLTLQKIVFILGTQIENFSSGYLEILKSLKIY